MRNSVLTAKLGWKTGLPFHSYYFNIKHGWQYNTDSRRWSVTIVLYASLIAAIASNFTSTIASPWWQFVNLYNTSVVTSNDNISSTLFRPATLRYGFLDIDAVNNAVCAVLSQCDSLHNKPIATLSIQSAYNYNYMQFENSSVPVDSTLIAPVFHWHAMASAGGRSNYSFVADETATIHTQRNGTFEDMIYSDFTTAMVTTGLLTGAPSLSNLSPLSKNAYNYALVVGVNKPGNYSYSNIEYISTLNSIEGYGLIRSIIIAQRLTVACEYFPVDLSNVDINAGNWSFYDLTINSGGGLLSYNYSMIGSDGTQCISENITFAAETRMFNGSGPVPDVIVDNYDLAGNTLLDQSANNVAAKIVAADYNMTNANEAAKVLPPQIHTPEKLFTIRLEDLLTRISYTHQLGLKDYTGKLETTILVYGLTNELSLYIVLACSLAWLVIAKGILLMPKYTYVRSHVMEVLYCTTVDDQNCSNPSVDLRDIAMARYNDHESIKIKGKQIVAIDSTADSELVVHESSLKH